MVTGIEAALISSSGKVLAAALPKIITKMEQVLAKRNGLEGHVGTLDTFLSSIQSFILDNRKNIRNDSVQSRRTWIANLRCVAYDMEDCLEGYRAKTIKADEKLYDKITKLKESVVELNKFVDDLNKTLNPPPDKADASSSTTTSSDPQRDLDRDRTLADLFGKEEHLREILGLSRRNETQPDTNLKVTMISVVGFAGIGTRNLCNHVYKEMIRHNNQSGQNQFSQYAFVSAAGKDVKKVLEELLTIIPKKQSLMSRIIKPFSSRPDVAEDSFGGHTNGSTSNDRHVQQYMMELAQRLRDNRYLIVVADVESGALATLLTCHFPENNMDSRIILALTVVGSMAEGIHFEGEDNESVNQAQEMGRQDRFVIVNSSSSTSLSMLMKRDGVPLALVSVSEFIRGYFNCDDVEEAWTQLCKAESDRWLPKKDLVLHHIYESLDTAASDSSYTLGPHMQGGRDCMNLYLPDLQACLLYFAIFPRNCDVKRGSLIRRWLAEGRQLGGTGFQDADKKLNLLNQKFVRPVDASLSNNQDQHLKTCQPPGVVLDFINNMSQQEAFIMLSCTQAHTPNDIRRLSLHPTVLHTGSRRRPPTDDGDLPPRLRTLAASRRTNACSITKCERLRVLDLEAYPCLQPKVLQDICEKLKLLKYLSLKPDNITEVPESISNLKLLETLDMGTDKVVLIPIHVFELPCLKYLLGKFEFKNSPISAAVKKCFKKLQNNENQKDSSDIKNSKLEKLAGFVTRKAQGIPPLMRHMTKIWKVKIWFYSDADAEAMKEYLPEAITNFLQNYNGTCDPTLSLDFLDCPNPEKLLDSLEKAKGKVYSLKLCGKNLRKIHKFVSNLQGITKLHLSWATMRLDASFLNELSNLEQLKYLKLYAVTIKAAYGVNPQAGNNPEKVVIEPAHIKNVERLCLAATSALPEIEVQPLALSKLVSFHLISEDINSPSPNVIYPPNLCQHEKDRRSILPQLKEVVLNARLTGITKSQWFQAAGKRSKTPQILFIQYPHRTG